MNAKGKTKRYLRKLGYVVNKFDVLHSEEKRRMLLLRHFNISNIIDVGANEGQYGLEMRGLGYSGKLFSFEPVTEVFSKLQKAASHDPNWEVFNYALGEVVAEKDIFISDNSQCSSLTKVRPRYQETAPRSIQIGKQSIQIATLDSVWDKLAFVTGGVILKLDVQGYEKMVLQGSQQSLKYITGIQIELSFDEMYEGEMVFDEAVSYLRSLGYSLKSLTPVHCDKRTGEIMQLDGTFFRQQQS